MERFEITILGCGAALPTPRHIGSAQMVNVREKLFMIDCAEGVQTAVRRSRLKFSHMNAIFLSHLHGDHCFGLMGLLSTLGLLGRTATLDVYGPCDLIRIFQPQIEYFCKESPYPIVLHEYDHRQSQVIHEDRSLQVINIPLSHGFPCCGFLFVEKQLPRHIRRDVIDAYCIPVSQINNLKAGLDWTSPDGEIIPNELLTTPPDPIRSYAYFSDTKPSSTAAQLVRNHMHELGTNLTAMYHEATFANEHTLMARKTNHSTASQAGQIAREAEASQLIIGHFSSRYKDEQTLLQEAKAEFADTTLASDGKVFRL